MTKLKTPRKRSRRRARRGVVLVLVALFAAILIGMAAFAVDLAYVQLSKAQLRTAADAAAKAGVATLRQSKDPALASKAAIDFASRNIVNGRAMTLVESDLEFGQSIRLADGSWGFKAGLKPFRALRVNAKLTEGSNAGPIPAFFGRIFGHDHYETSLQAVASQYEQQLVLCLDRSHSMCFDLTGKDWVYPANVPSPFEKTRYTPVDGSRWVSLENAVGSFLKALPATGLVPEVALVTWSSDVTESSSEFKILGRTMPAATIDVPLTKDYAAITTSVTTRGDDVVIGATNMSSGLAQAIAVLDGSTNPLSQKTILLMTDGLWNRGADPTIVAKAAVDAGYVIHTITFLPGAQQTAMTEIAAMTGGKHYFADDEASLREAFAELATMLPVVLTE
ncbi:MAG: vWA domain-containing protein [Pirellulales bacterium]